MRPRIQWLAVAVAATCLTLAACSDAEEEASQTPDSSDGDSANVDDQDGGAAADTVTDTDTVADTDTVTGTDTVTDTDTVTGTDTVTDTDTVTAPDSLTDAAPGADAVTTTDGGDVACKITSPTCPGAAMPVWKLEDKHPKSKGFGKTYGLEMFVGKVTLVALLAGW